jgi:two-component system chemotaxis response regulator CheB
MHSAAAVLAALPGSFPVPLLLLLHGRRRHAAEPERLAPLLQRFTELPVRTAVADMTLGTPGVTVLPSASTASFDAGRRMQLIEATATTGGDALLTAAADALGPTLIGVILTGMLHDGTDGVRAIKRGGGRVLAEDPRTARAGGMPTSAIASGCVDFVLPAHRIAPALVALSMAPGGAELFTVPTPAWATLH